MGVSRSAGRVARRRIVSALAAYRLACARLIGSAVLIAGPRESRNDLTVPGRKVVPSAVPPSFGDAALQVTDGPVVGPGDRRCPLSLALCAGAYRLVPRMRPSRSVRRLPGPFPAVVAPVSTSHRVSLPTLDGYSSRSSPVLRDVAGGWQARGRASSVR